MSAIFMTANMTTYVATPKPPMHFEYTHTFKMPVVDDEALHTNQYDYPGAIVSHGGLVGATNDENTEGIRKKQHVYPGAFVSHGETIEDVPEFEPKQKKYMWTSVVDFFKQRQKFQRHPFTHIPNI